MKYGYARCSTNESKQDIKRQIRDLKKIGVDEKNIYFEYESGLKVDREQLNRLLKVVQEGDTIASTEVSRLSRSTKQLCELIEFANEKKIKLIIGNMIIDCSNDNLDPMTKAMLEMMSVFAELERNMIVSRIKSGLDNARSKGKKIGRPELSIENLPVKFIKHYPKYKNKELNITEYADLINCSRPTVYKYIKMYESIIDNKVIK